ncbi:GNAT family N-acetyltransferase [Burkholderia sp. WAC0059]|nr:GNAT family N-acetyltransferase [Burkholderia sp. WAC0059]
MARLTGFADAAHDDAVADPDPADAQDVQDARTVRERADGRARAARAGVSIRAVATDDMTALADMMGLPGVRRDTLGVSYRTPESMRQWFEKQQNGNGMVGLVATAGDTSVPVGLAALTFRPPRRTHCASLLLCVHDDWQGRGIGGALLGALMECADRSFGLRRIELTVYVDNAPALALYRRAGFGIEGRARGYALRDGVYADVYRMARLAPAAPFDAR